MSKIFIKILAKIIYFIPHYFDDFLELPVPEKPILNVIVLSIFAAEVGCLVVVVAVAVVG